MSISSVPYLSDNCAIRPHVILWSITKGQESVMQGSDVREVYETILPDEIVLELAREFGFQERQRQLDAALFIRSMVMSASTGGGGRQADAMRQYVDCGGTPLARSAFYRRFGVPLERCMEKARDRALEYVARQERDLPGFLGDHVEDWHAYDSTTVKLDDRLKDEYPGTGQYAALKIHKRFSLGVGTTIDYHLSPARDHDSKHLTINESWRGLGLLADLGYASHQLLRDCEQHGVYYVIRLKENWKPKVTYVARGTVNRTFAQGSDLDMLLERETIELDGKAIDADVEIGAAPRTIYCRMVAVDTPKGYCFYLTNLPPSVGPRQVADLYRVRWEIESDNKLDKSCHQLDKIQARTGPAVRALVHASIVASVMICLHAHHHRLRETPPPRRNAERTKPPIHPQLLARAMVLASPRISSAMELKGKAAKEEWDRIAVILEHQAKDPNWRRRPSTLDQLRGWKIKPKKSRKSRDSSKRKGVK